MTVKCKQCDKKFSTDKYDEQTAHGWFCSGDCIEQYAKNTKQTVFMVIHGCGTNCKTAAMDGVV